MYSIINISLQNKDYKKVSYPSISVEDGIFLQWLLSVTDLCDGQELGMDKLGVLSLLTSETIFV
jgi:hypothetical protein